MQLQSRALNLFAAVFCFALLGAAYYFQYVEGMEPCPLCIFQRIMVLAVGVLLLINGLHNPAPGRWGDRVYAILGVILSGLGIFIAGRHVWLQSLPESEVPACGPALDYLVDVLPLTELIRTVLTGSGECAQISWSFLGISMPGWVLIIFIGFALWFLLRLISAFRPRTA